MDTKFKYLLGSVVFLACAGTAFWVTKNLQKPEEQDNKELIVSNSGVADPSAPIDSVEIREKDSITTSSPNPLEPLVLEPIKMKTEVQKVGDSYTLHVTCPNVPVNVLLGYEIPALRQKNSDGYFTRIPGCKSGSYKVNVINSNTGEILVSKTVSGFKLAEEKVSGLMTAHEFEALLLNQNDNSLLGGKHPNVARNIRLSFEGLKEDERKPNDILDVRLKIANGIWSSARVIGVNYDENGKIYAVRIQPIY